MKTLTIDYDYYQYPNSISSLEEFIEFLDNSNSDFIKLNQFQTENCCYPYFVKEDIKEMYLKISNINRICEEEITFLTREDYDTRLKQIVSEKCVHCVHYSENCDGDNLDGHRNMITLDGDCSLFEKIDN